MRSGADTSGGSRGTNTSCLEELSEEGQRNLLTSTMAAAALKERYTGVNAGIASGSSSSSSTTTTTTTGARGGGVDWRKIDWVRQQCRYTGEAMLKSPVKEAPHTKAALRRENAPPSPSVSSSFSGTIAAPGSTEAGEKSVGARLVESLLYPFTPSTASSAHALETTRTSADDAAAENVVPHGDGVMTYLLYCKPKNGGYANLAGGSTSEAINPDPSRSAVPIASPFLPPDLIPTAYCPPLTEIETTTVSEDGLTSTDAGAKLAAPPVPHLLLLSLVVYEGSFVNGKRHGRGRLTAYGRLVLECNWSEDVPSLVAPLSIASHARSEEPPAPTLWNVDAHVWTPPPAAPPAPPSTLNSLRPRRAHITTKSVTKANEACQCSCCAPSGTWSIKVTQAYMGSLMLATVASKRLLAKMEACMGSSAASLTAKAAAGAHYIGLPVPRPQPPSDRAASSDAFRGLGWVNHVVFLPNCFGEAHFRADSGPVRSDAPSASPVRTVSALGGSFQPPIWVPETSAAAAAAASLRYSTPSPPSLCWQYCGQWSAGLPHGFGAAAERLTDPTVGTVPPHYPWRSLFLGQYMSGKRCGPGTYHGAQGSEATGVVVCGTWPRHDQCNTNPAATAAASEHQEQGTANIVLLPVSSAGVICPTDFEPADTASSPPPPTLSSSFFSLQGACWSNSDADDNSGCNAYGSGGGSFPAAKLRQSAAALSGMWEPLFRDVDNVVTRQSPSLPLDAEESGGAISNEPVGDQLAASDASPSRKVRLWRRACSVMDNFVTCPEFDVALRTFQATFAFMYGTNLEIGTAAKEKATTPSSKPAAPSTLQNAMPGLLQRLENAVTVALSSSATSSMGYPWCPAHSWCAMAHLRDPIESSTGTQGSLSYAGCLHAGLADGATHRHPPPTTSRLGTPQSSGYTRAACSKRSTVRTSLRPPLSAVAAALEPFAAAHTFTHAVHAAAAFVSSLRLRLLSCFATDPDLCEVVMGDRESEEKILQYCWHIVFGCVGSVLVKKATAVAVADVGLVWKLLGLRSEGGKKETLTDYFVALRRCRSLAKADMVEMAHSEVYEARDADILSPLSQCAERLGDLLGLLTGARSCSSALGTPTHTFSSELQKMTTILLELHAFVGTKEDISGAATIPTNPLASPGLEDPTATFTLAQREALLRWTLFSAAVGHPAVASIASHGGSGRHPFAFLLIAHTLLSGQITPVYPILMGEGSARNNNSSGHPSRHDLLLLLRDIGRSTMELMHTFPSVRAWAPLPSPPAPKPSWTTSVVCPLDTLALKLEYALSPCAALHLCVSSPPHPISGAAVGVASPLEPGGSEGGCPDATAEIRPCPGGAPKASTIYINLQHLSHEALQWCRRELTERLTVSLLETRLQRYWRRLPPKVAQHASRKHHPRDVDGALAPHHHDTPPPSPLMRWLLVCLQGMLSSPLLPQALVKPSGGSTPAKFDLVQCHTPQASSSSLGHAGTTAPRTRYTWKKFISAVFFSDAEREAWSSTQSPTKTAATQALSLMDKCYVTALAYTLHELAGMELNLEVRFVFEDEEEEEERSTEAHGQDSREAGSVGHRSPLLELAGSSSQMENLDQLHSRRKNIFLSSSSFSSSASLSSPRPNSAQSGGSLEREGYDAHTGDDSPTSGNTSHPKRSQGDRPTATTTTWTRRRPISQEASRSTSVHASPRDRPLKDNERLQRQSAVGAGPEASPLTSGPVGKEWELVLVLPPGSRHDSAEQVTAKSHHPPFFSTLTWEVMEQVCSRVHHQLHATTPPSNATEDEKRKKSKAVKAKR
ncbi:hypothetical protein JKF63_05979 [Porcisia hertigi]|uniref:Uncharacterized protein n=1 Tax=Porcisia hertigi TaxID=2761500 RepID=A0A836I887_9TRYP|nr:hypothetical protein JKF63_05979 [Porcisia hertigi]